LGDIEFAGLTCGEGGLVTEEHKRAFAQATAEKANAELFLGGKAQVVTCSEVICQSSTRRRATSLLTVRLAGSPLRSAVALSDAVSFLEVRVTAGTLFVPLDTGSGIVSIRGTKWDSSSSQVLGGTTLAPTTADVNSQGSGGSSDANESIALIIGLAVGFLCIIMIITTLIFIERKRTHTYDNQNVEQWPVESFQQPAGNVPSEFDVVSGMLLSRARAAQQTSFPAQGSHYYPATEYAEQVPYLDVRERPYQQSASPYPTYEPKSHPTFQSPVRVATPRHFYPGLEPPTAYPSHHDKIPAHYYPSTPGGLYYPSTPGPASGHPSHVYAMRSPSPDDLFLAMDRSQEHAMWEKQWGIVSS
jgi:hypothetical protein